jgi:hypothetical protein
MTSTSWYHLEMYRAQKLLLKHSQIRGIAQTIFLKHHQIQNKAKPVHVKQGDVSVHPRDDFLSRYEPLNVIVKRRVDETHCFRVRFSNQETSIILSHLWICVQAINQLRQFLTNRQKEQYIRCEVRLFLRTRQQHCFRGIINGIRKVACA